MKRLLILIAGSCLVATAGGGFALAEGLVLAQYNSPHYGYPPPNPPPCQAVTPSPLRGAAGGAARGALVGAVFGNAGRGAAIGAGVGGVAAASRRATARSYGACY